MSKNNNVKTENSHALHAILSYNPEEKSEPTESIEELNNQLQEMGHDISEVNASVERNLKKFAGKWAMKQARARRKNRQGKTDDDKIPIT